MQEEGTGASALGGSTHPASPAVLAPRIHGVSGEELAQQAADRVRDVIAEAERRATEIVREAEREAELIRERARAETPDPRPPQPEPTPPVPHPDPTPTPGDPIPEPPSPEPAVPPATQATAAATNGAVADDTAARLTAMKLAIDGKGRDEIASELESKFGAGDRRALLDDVLARAGR